MTTLHGTDITIVGQDRSYLPMTRFAIEKSDAVTAVSEHLRQVTIEVFQPKKAIDVIPNFIDPERFSPERRRSLPVRAGRHASVLMHVSNFRPGQAHPRRGRDLRPRPRAHARARS